MAERPRGNVVYEILIVVLVAALIAAILYPAKVWKSEDELQNVCRNRMDTIHQMELFYLGETGIYSDSLPEVKDKVLSDPVAVAALDSMVFWDGLVTQKDLKQLVLGKQFPQVLKEHIREKLEKREPLGNLAKWDSLGVRLISKLRETLSDSSAVATLDSGITWRTLMGEETFRNMLDTLKVPRWVRRRTVYAVNKGKPIFATVGWKYYKPFFYSSLRNLIATAQQKNVWQKQDEDRWEQVAKKRWETDMDTLSSEAKDSLWQNYKQRFWERQKELVWKKERKKLWQEEKATWTKDNASLWERVVLQNWTSARKKKWEKETLAKLPDSLVANFKAKKDSLWRVAVDSIKTKEYESWKQKHKSDIDKMIHQLWESDRKVSWESGARAKWFAAKEANKEALWKELKEELWNIEKTRLWQKEQNKLAQKIGAQERLDKAVKWESVLGAEEIDSLVNQLILPDSPTLWKLVENKIKKKEKANASVLYNLGLAELFRPIMIDSLDCCPVAHVSYLMTVDDTSTVKHFSIRCPIVVDSSKVTYALKVDPVTKDTTKVILKLPAVQRILGGGKIKNHGFIDKDGKKSWERKSR